MFNLFRKARPDAEVIVREEPISHLSEADIVINGHMRGSIRGRCDVVVDVKGHCVGGFAVKNLAIHGTVIGDVYADELIIHPTGQLYFSKISAQKTIVHDGGVYANLKDTPDKDAESKKRAQPL